MKLGRIEKVELRTFWKKEDRDFTHNRDTQSNKEKKWQKYGKYGS